MRKVDILNIAFKDPLGEEARAQVYIATVVHAPWRVVEIEFHHDTKDIVLTVCSRPTKPRN